MNYRIRSLGRFRIPKKYPRYTHRKFTRTAMLFLMLARGYFFGATTICLLWALSSNLCHAQTAPALCGGTSQPRCEVNAPVDEATKAVDNTARATIEQKTQTVKGTLTWLSVSNFTWSFIPDIPTAPCQNPLIASPIGGTSVEMDICSSFYVFQTFINGVLAVFCLYGCVGLVQRALEA